MTSTAEQIVLLELIKRRVTAALDTVKARARDELDPGDRQTGAITTPAGRFKIGAVTLTDPKPSARVTDRAAFTAWVEQHDPSAIETIRNVRASTERALLATGCDDDGEVLPGVEFVAGAPVLQVRPEADAMDTLTQHLAASGLSMTSLLASLDIDSIEAGR